MKLTRQLKPLRGPADMTPFLTVILLLLLFFLLSSSYIAQPGIRIDLPRSFYGNGTLSDRLLVTVTLQPGYNDGTNYIPGQPLIFFNDKLMKLEQFQEALKLSPKNLQKQPLILKADKQVPLGVITDIMNAAMANGMSVVIATREPEPVSHEEKNGSR